MKDKQPQKGNQSMKRQRTLIDEEDVEPSPLRFPNDAIIEDLPLTAPQASQDSASTQHQSFFGKSFGQFIFGSSSSYPEFNNRGLEVEEDVPWKPRGVSEFKSRILQRQKQPKPTGLRQIKFLHDGIDSTKPSDLYAPKGLSWNGNA
ncbi:hypothetical protein FXO38_28393 [Capsicum annuum]|nr:hypothetical protein FXO38_28393 [Capsicum annuum]